jgi:hypothetical protein
MVAPHLLATQAWVTIRFGVAASAVLSFTSWIFLVLPLTGRHGAWYSVAHLVAMGLALAVACYGSTPRSEAAS